MGDADEIVLIDKGTLRPIGPGAVDLLRRCQGRYQIAVASPSLLVMRAESRSSARILMAGEIASKMAMVEIVNVIATSNWRGELRVLDHGRFERVLAFDQGALKNAQSSHPDDRLGAVLYRHGVLTRIQLSELLRDDSPDRRFGQLVVERGLLGQDQLFEYLRKQAEHIFHVALLVAEGLYTFGIPDDADAPAPATVHVSVQTLLMQSVQRIDEMALFRERIPSNQLCPERRTGAPDKKLDGTSEEILKHCDGTTTIQDIARLASFDEFQTTKVVYHLLQQGRLTLHSSPSADESAVVQLVERFNDVLRDIFMAVAAYGGLDPTHATVATWIEGSGYQSYFGERLEEDGTISAGRLLEAVRDASQAAHPVETIHQALHELTAFALFAATSSLPRDQERALSRDTNRRLKAIRM